MSTARDSVVADATSPDSLNAALNEVHRYLARQVQGTSDTETDDRAELDRLIAATVALKKRFKRYTDTQATRHLTKVTFISKERDPETKQVNWVGRTEDGFLALCRPSMLAYGEKFVRMDGLIMVQSYSGGMCHPPHVKVA